MNANMLTKINLAYEPLVQQPAHIFLEN